MLNLCFANTKGDFSGELGGEMLISRSKITMTKVKYGFFSNVRDALGGYFIFFGNHQIKNHAAPR